MFAITATSSLLGAVLVECGRAVTDLALGGRHLMGCTIQFCLHPLRSRRASSVRLINPTDPITSPSSPPSLSSPPPPGALLFSCFTSCGFSKARPLLFFTRWDLFRERKNNVCEEARREGIQNGTLISFPSSSWLVLSCSLAPRIESQTHTHTHTQAAVKACERVFRFGFLCYS